MKNTLKEQVREFSRLMRSCRFQEAFNRFYDKHTLLVDADGTTYSGVRNSRKHFNCWTMNLKAIEVKSVFVWQSMVILEWYFIYGNRVDGRVDYYQVSVQQWEKNKIIRERQYRQVCVPKLNLN